MIEALLSLMIAAQQPRAVSAPVPIGGPVTLDGRIGADEWRDGIRLVAGGFELIAKASGTDLLLAVRFEEPQAAGVDIFVDTRSGGILNLHASAQLGERGVSGGGWIPWAWGNNSRWTSHTTSRDPATGRFPDQEGREFKIERALLPAERVRIRVVIHGRRQIAWPETALEFNSATWAPLRLPPVVHESGGV